MNLLRSSSAAPRPRSAMRVSADPDDMEDLLRHVRRGVEARTQTQVEQESAKSNSKPHVPARGQSIAQEGEPSLAPRSAVRGRYVFSGQVLGPPGRVEGDGLPSPRPLDFARRPRRTEENSHGSSFHARQAAEAMAVECSEVDSS
ncbi:unnamed protein product [Durusdinium trenchii]|uniref:Uncharacterized protein n=1 Tax=Durusdinium trenchii TaxID=1381693 RepID=A0ABP0LSA3_9DINO